MKARVMVSAVLCAVAGGAAGAFGGVPTYTAFQIQARTNFGVNPGGSFNVPPNWFFSGEDIQVNNAREVAFHLSVTSGDFHALWFGGDGTGMTVRNTEIGGFMSQTSLNNNGLVVWTESFVTTPGVYFYNSDNGMNGFYTNQPFGATSWGSPSVNDSGQVGYRAGFAGSNAFVSYDKATNSNAVHVVEVGLDPSSPYSFLFTPSFNNNRQIAGKARRGPGTGNNNPDEIRIWNSNGSSVLIAEDVDANPMSPYSAFDNSVALNDNGYVAFMANLVAGGRGVFLSNGTVTQTIATTNDPEISNLEFFGPSLNNHGLVAFRAIDAAGLRAIWVGNGSALTRVVTEHDLLPTDIPDPAARGGTLLGRIDQHDSSPVFGGKPSINDHGDVAFNCGLTPPDNNQIEWGSGVYVALAPPASCEGDADGDGDVDIDDITFVVLRLGNTGAPGLQGDVDGNGFVNIDDITFVVLRLGTCPS